MGLLDGLFDSESGRLGLGLLAAGSARGDGAGAGQRLQEAIGSVDQWKQAQAKDAFMKMQMDNYKSEIAQRQVATQKQAFIQNFIQKKLMGDGGSGQGMTQPPRDVGMGGGQGMTFGGVGGNAGGASPIPSNANPGGLGNMSLDDITSLKTLGGPDLLNNWKIAKEGFERKPGTFYEGVNGKREYIGDPTKGITLDGQGSVTTMPGAIKALSDLAYASKDAEARATNNNTLAPSERIDPTTNRPYNMTVGGLISQVNGQQAPSATQPQPVPQTPQPKQSGFAGGSASAAAVGQRQILEQELRKPNLSPEDKSAIERELSRLPQASNGGFNGFAGPMDTGRVKNITEATGKVNDAWIKTSYESTVKSGDTAQSIIDSTMVARDSLRKIGGGGWGTETKAAAANFLTGLGVASQNAQMFAANAQIFEKTAADRLLATLAEQVGPQTEGDAQRGAKTFANLKNTPQANEFILDLAQAKAERDKAKAAFYSNALPIAQSKGDLAEVDREWKKRAPSVFAMPSMQRWK